MRRPPLVPTGRDIPVEVVATNVINIAESVAKGAEVRTEVRRTRSANVRFARNAMTTSGEYDDMTVSVSIALGRRHAYTTSNQTDQASVKTLVERAVTMARLSPEDPEKMPLLPPATYAPAPSSYDEALAKMSPVDRASIANRAVAAGDKESVQIAGFFYRDAVDRAIRSSTGMNARHLETEAQYTVTARTPDATGSGWAGRELHKLAELDDGALSRTAIAKAVRSARPRPIPPGKYTVILEPVAVAEMISFLIGEMNLRSADEGRSYFTGKVGEKLFPDIVSLMSEPGDASTPGATFDGEGMPLKRQSWIEAGRVRDLFVSRYWGEKKGVPATGSHRVHRLVPGPRGARGATGAGGATTLDDLVAGTKRGLLVTRFWYTRMLEPQTVMLTGLTRDGLFLIEDGKVTAPLTNFRYNESPITMLKNVDAMTSTTTRTPTWGGIWHMPALRTNEFTMASPSAAV